MKRRNTPTKLEIMQIFNTSESALSHEMLQEKLGLQVDRTTIYRMLNRLLEDGVVHQIIGDDGKKYYALCADCQDTHHQHSHFHFRCLNCGTVDCLDNEIEVKLPKGYKGEIFNGIISGYCHRCNG